MEAAEILEDQDISENLAARAGKQAMAQANPLEKNGYKVPLFETIIKRAAMNLISYE
jgi:CO/xanthine dehydrogenase FAD-binding subunit